MKRFSAIIIIIVELLLTCSIVKCVITTRFSTKFIPDSVTSISAAIMTSTNTATTMLNSTETTTENTSSSSYMSSTLKPKSYTITSEIVDKLRFQLQKPIQDLTRQINHLKVSMHALENTKNNTIAIDSDIQENDDGLVTRTSSELYSNESHSNINTSQSKPNETHSINVIDSIKVDGQVLVYSITVITILIKLGLIYKFRTCIRGSFRGKLCRRNSSSSSNNNDVDNYGVGKCWRYCGIKSKKNDSYPTIIHTEIPLAPISKHDVNGKSSVVEQFEHVSMVVPPNKKKIQKSRTKHVNFV